MQIELKRIQTEVGLTFVHVTHDQEEAMTMADTIAVMNAGVIEQMGAPERALREPAHHVRRQLPRPVQPDRGHDHRAAAADVVTVDMHGTSTSRCRPTASHADGDRGWVGIRPEKVLIGDAGDDARRAGQHHPRRRRHRRQLRRRQHAVPRPDAVGPGAPGLRAEHRAHAGCFRTGDAGRPVLAAGARVPARPQPGRRGRRRARGPRTEASGGASGDRTRAAEPRRS